MLKQLFVICVLVLAVSAVYAVAPITLTDPSGTNSTVVIDPGNPTGMFLWSVEGQNQVKQSSYWYRIGDVGPAFNIASLGSYTVNQSVSSDATVTYTGQDFDVQVGYSLIGSDPGSGTSDLAEWVNVVNKSCEDVTFNLFSYDSFDILGNSVADLGGFSEPSYYYQFDGMLGGPGVEVAAVTGPDYVDVGDATALRNQFNMTSFTNLSNNMGVYTGDAAMAMQWHMGSYGGFVFRDKLISGVPSRPGPVVPDASCAVLGATGIGMLGLIRKKRSRA